MRKFTFIFIVFSVTTITALRAQQAADKQPAAQPHAESHNITPAQMSGNPLAAQYYYRVFTAPGNEKGYDIFKNNRLVFHQPATTNTRKQPGGNNLIAVKQKPVEAQAKLSIEKLKQGLPPALTDREKFVATTNAGNTAN